MLVLLPTPSWTLCGCNGSPDLPHTRADDKPKMQEATLGAPLRPSFAQRSATSILAFSFCDLQSVCQLCLHVRCAPPLRDPPFWRLNLPREHEISGSSLYVGGFFWPSIKYERRKSRRRRTNACWPPTTAGFGAYSAFGVRGSALNRNNRAVSIRGNIPRHKVQTHAKCEDQATGV